uniref:Uncharacterized protein n=1 Tax=Strongyloides stercoralis TaxID=6248 RepID=A0A0K0ET50_STRER
MLQNYEKSQHKFLPNNVINISKSLHIDISCLDLTLKRLSLSGGKHFHGNEKKYPCIGKSNKNFNEESAKMAKKIQLFERRIGMMKRRNEKLEEFRKLGNKITKSNVNSYENISRKLSNTSTEGSISPDNEKCLLEKELLQINKNINGGEKKKSKRITKSNSDFNILDKKYKTSNTIEKEENNLYKKLCICKNNYHIM